jgi:hypothetical protein
MKVAKRSAFLGGMFTSQLEACRAFQMAVCASRCFFLVV